MQLDHRPRTTGLVEELMGSFKREGTFQDRGKLLTAFKAKLEKLTEGTLAGMKHSWEAKGTEDHGSLRGFGVEALITVRASDWSCDVSTPAWLPIPQSKVEEMFDSQFAELKDL